MWSPTVSSDELYHYGVLGMRWGIRRYQNYDGTRKAAGKKHEAEKRNGLSDDQKKALKTAALVTGGVLLTAAVVGGTIYLANGQTINPKIFKAGSDICDNFADNKISDLQDAVEHVGDMPTEEGKKIADTLGFKLKDKPTTYIEDAMMGNPDWTRAKENLTEEEFFEEGWKNNCSHSVLNFIMRRKGLDTTALPMSKIDQLGGLDTGQLCQYFKNCKVPNPPFSLSGPQTNENYMTQIQNHILTNVCNGENGACGSMTLWTKTGQGHFISWYNDNGNVILLDTQANKNNADGQITKLVKNIWDTNNIDIVRLDDKELRLDLLGDQAKDFNRLRPFSK